MYNLAAQVLKQGIIRQKVTNKSGYMYIHTDQNFKWYT